MGQVFYANREEIDSNLRPHFIDYLYRFFYLTAEAIWLHHTVLHVCKLQYLPEFNTFTDSSLYIIK